MMPYSEYEPMYKTTRGNGNLTNISVDSEKFLTVIDEFVVMPNHIHGIHVILERAINVETPRRGVSTISKWEPGTLGAIIN